jgi:hypothetical protein
MLLWAARQSICAPAIAAVESTACILRMQLPTSMGLAVFVIGPGNLQVVLQVKLESPMFGAFDYFVRY